MMRRLKLNPGFCCVATEAFDILNTKDKFHQRPPGCLPLCRRMQQDHPACSRQVQLNDPVVRHPDFLIADQAAISSGFLVQRRMRPSEAALQGSSPPSENVLLQV